MDETFYFLIFGSSRFVFGKIFGSFLSRQKFNTARFNTAKIILLDNLDHVAF